ncbi:MAG: hypothetical protein K6A41_00790 [Bacteroidales bacterium]|nr:hypothetical protein [Bacteroidales bacterium]
MEKIREDWMYLNKNALWYDLANTLPDKELFKLIENHPFLYSIVEKRKIQAKYRQFLHKKINKYIQELESPDCKQKCWLRSRLMDYYPKVSANDQKRIVKLMLHQPKQERTWACRKLKHEWHPEYEKEIVDLFDQLHDEECAKIIMYHLSDDIVEQRSEILAQLVGQHWVRQRLWNIRPEMRKLDDLVPMEKVRTILNLKLTEHQDELETILYQGIASEVECILTRGERNNERHRLSTPWDNFTLDKNGMLSTDFFFNHVIEELMFPVPFNDFQNIRGYYLLIYFHLLGINGEEVNHTTQSLFSFSQVKFILWTMGQMDLADPILRFYELDRKLLFYTVHDTAEQVANELLQWLIDIYEKINVEMLGYPKLEEEYTHILNASEWKKHLIEKRPDFLREVDPEYSAMEEKVRQFFSYFDDEYKGPSAK